ncbi:MAG TPA: NADPH:quinone reductase [Vicinamibacterales bacterium]|nr:NADPH:quinone reductase [Vicinamibacterales bacterium]
MKALVVREFGGPEVMKVEDVPAPSAGPGQILIRVKAVGVNPVDTYIRSGMYARKPNLPYTPHADIAGTVESVGDGVTKVKPGDRVYAYMVDGGGAELAGVDEWQVQRLPERASFAQGAAIGVPYATAWRALFLKTNSRPGETVLVHGASGAVGVASVQLARAHGMRVIGTAGTAEGLRLVREQGAHEALNHREPDYLTKIPALTGGRGPDVILEMMANVNLDHDLDILAPHGRIMVIGNRGRVEIDARKMMGKDGAMLGMTLFNTTRDEFREIHASIVAGLENGTLNPVVRKEVPLAQAAQAHVEVMEPGALGKIVLVP